MRVCNKCGVSKPLSKFYKYSRTSEARKLTCAECCSKYSKLYRDKNKDSMRARQIAYKREQNYGISEEKYLEMYQAQSGLCLICNKPETRLNDNGSPRNLAVDHDHQCCPGKRSCGKCVRGLLCDGCNRGLGFLQDDINLLISAAMYLAQNEKLRQKEVA